jgi:hypothetical protein
MTYGGHSEVTKGSYNCLSVQEAGAWHARALEGGEMEGRNRIRLEGFWEGLTNQELHAALCAKINETPSRPEFTVEGGEGNPHEEEVEWRCTGLTRFGFAWCGAE